MSDDAVDPSPVPPPIPLDQVDLDALSSTLHSFDGYFGFSYKPSTGEIRNEVDEHGNPVDLDAYPPDVVPIEYLGNRGAYRDMEDFIAALGDCPVAERLEQAIRGKHAFRSFKEVLVEHVEQAGQPVKAEWHAFSDARRYRRTITWLRSWDLIDEPTRDAAFATHADPPVTRLGP